MLSIFFINMKNRNIYLPVYVKVTDFAVTSADRVKIVSTWSLHVDENSITVNKGTRVLSHN